MPHSAGSSLFHHFEKNFFEYADKPLLQSQNLPTITYGEAYERSGRVANVLKGAGLKAGDRVSVQADKSPDYLFLYLACLRSGLVFHPINPAYRQQELQHLLQDAEPSVFVTSAESGEQEALSQALGAAKILHLTTGQTGLGAPADDAFGEFESVSLSKSDLAALLYSSGTTGKPKGVMLTQENLASNTQALVRAWDFSHQDVLLHALPVFHVHGLFIALGCVLLSGASMRWLDKFQADRVIEELPHCSVMMGVPTYYSRLLEDSRVNRDSVHHIRVFVSGSAPLHPAVSNSFKERTGHRILERYGMTETSVITTNPLKQERRPGTVGKPLGDISVRVASDDGVTLSSGQTGGVQVKGPNVFAGYWKLPDKTRQEFTDDGYFKTGDLGVWDADGYLSIVGRSKDLIITGGLNVYPKEIELFVDTCEGIQESAVIGVPHSDFGEAVVAVVVASAADHPTSEVLMQRCKQNLAGFKVPKRVVFVSELPRNAMGKVQKNQLRDHYCDLFSASA